MQTRLKTHLYLVVFAFFTASASAIERQFVPVNDYTLHVTTWNKSTENAAHRPHVLLLSGPTDNWNSDSAWFARLAPRLTKDFQVITVDRAWQVNPTPRSATGYRQFGRDLKQLLAKLKIPQVHIIAFASGNLALHQLVHEAPLGTVLSALLIDPDVLSPFSINRYKQDAEPFLKHLEKYRAYITSGQYDQRAKEKNTIDRAHLQALAAGDPLVNWQYIDAVFEARLKHQSLQKQFTEIAHYGTDLESARDRPLPKSLPLVIIDTDFETKYLPDATPEDRKGLVNWQKDGREYYQSQIDRALHGRYIHMATQEHLLPFSAPDQLVAIFKQLTNLAINRE